MQLKSLFRRPGRRSPRLAGRESVARRARIARIASAVLVSISAGAAAVAQQGSSAPAGDADPFAGIEEMVVVGQSLSGSLTTSSTAVTSFDALKLESLGVNSIQDVASFTPNLEIRSASATTPAFFIRGVGLNDFTANASSAVAVYVDDAPRNLPAIQLGTLFDTANIDVQKGPQGSGPGRNASAGAIRVTTKKPTGEYDASLTIDYGNYDFVDVEGALEAPIVEDVLGWRTAFKMVRRDGIVTNRCGGKTLDQVANPGPLGTCGEASQFSSPGVFQIQPGLAKNLNNKNLWAARTSLRFNPPGIDDMEWNFVAHIDRTDQLATVGQHLGALSPALGGGDVLSYRAPEVEAEFNEIFAKLNPAQCNLLPAGPPRNNCRSQLNTQAGNILGSHLAQRPLDKLPFEGDYNTPGYERQTSFGGTLTGDWEISGIELKSITGFEKYDRDRLIDADYSPNTLFEFHIGDRAWQATQDLRVSGELDFLPISWKTGGFYLQETLDYTQETLAGRGFLIPLGQKYRQKTKSAGVFFDITWHLLDDLTLDAGARYNWEQKSFDADVLRQTRISSCVFDVGLGRVPPCTRTETLDHPTGTVALTYDFDELRSAYLKYSHGWKGLQFNARDGSVAAEVTDVASPEKIDAFEVGFKGTWLDDKIEVEGALFWYAYQNYQVFTFTNNPKSPPVRVVINADNASNFGAELNTTFRPIEGLTADVRFGWLETRFLDFTSSSTRPAPGGSGTQFFRLIFDYNNNQLPNAPRFKVSSGIEYAFDLNRFGRIVPRYDVNYTDDVNFDPSNGRGAPDASAIIAKPDHSIGQKAFVLQNVSLRYTVPSEQLSVIVWARNITNEVYKTLAFDSSGGPGFVGNLVGDPRTYGVTLKLTY